MRKQILFLAVVAVVTIAVSGTANANPFAIETTNTLEVIKQPDKATKTKTVKQKKYKVVSGDSLTKIAEMYNSSVQKLYDKNKQIKNPDVLKVGQVIVIPSKGEKLKHRATMSAVYSESPSKRLKTAHTAGNGYSYGYCTWYVKNKRPDIPNSWGNADTWDDYAPSSGYKVGSTPKAGAIGVTKAYMHVVYIEKVNKDGTVLVSEMNYNGWNVVSQRVAPASEFNYIY